MLMTLLNVWLGSADYTGPTALLNVNTTHTGAFPRGSLFRRTGLGAANSSYTEEGISYSDPITCVVSVIHGLADSSHDYVIQ